MARVIALMALAALGLTEAPVHEPVHDHHSERLMSTTESYHAPRNIRRYGRFLAGPFEEVNCPGRIDMCCGRSEGLFAAVEYLVVDRALIKIREHRLCVFWHVGSLVVRAHECLH